MGCVVYHEHLGVFHDFRNFGLAKRVLTGILSTQEKMKELLFSNTVAMCHNHTNFWIGRGDGCHSFHFPNFLLQVFHLYFVGSFSLQNRSKKQK